MSTLATLFTHPNNQPALGNGTPTVREGASLASDCQKRSQPTPPAAPSLTVGVPSTSPHTPPPRPRSPDLFQDFLNGEVSIDVICADHNLTPEQVLEWFESAQTQKRLDTLAKLDAARAHAIALTNRAEAMATLRRVMFTSKSLAEVRRAASAILRASNVPRLDGSAASRASAPATQDHGSSEVSNRGSPKARTTPPQSPPPPCSTPPVSNFRTQISDSPPRLSLTPPLPAA